MSESKIDQSTLLHVLVIGFHHQKGTQVEFCYPPIDFKDPLADKKEGEIFIPRQWNPLPYLAMPDGAHNYDDDCSFFHLPALTKGSKVSTDTVYGVACFRQIESKKLKNKDDNVTRTTVQKSVCILMKMPLYSFVLSKLELVTHAYFNELDFTKTDILMECFNSLSLQLSTMKIDDSLFHMGLCLTDIVTNFKEKVLVLFKLLLLEKKVVFWGNPVKDVCNFLLSVITLFPRLLHKGLLHSTCIDGIYQQKGTQTPHDQHGLPLDLFEEGCLFQPYMSLHNMTLLRKSRVTSFVIGCSNVLFKQKMHCPYDALVDLQTCTITIPDPALEQLLELSTEDLRMTDYIIAVVENSTETLGWEGSDDWLRLQFKAYLLCLLATVENTPPEALAELHPFNGPFCFAWASTNNYNKWAETDHPGMEHFHKGHPFQGDITASDLRLRLNQISQRFANEETREKIAHVLSRTQLAVGGAFSSAKIAFTSARQWISAMVQEVEVEMRKNTEERKPAVTNSDIDASSSQMVITDRDRQAEVRTIGDLIGNEEPKIPEDENT